MTHSVALPDSPVTDPRIYEEWAVQSEGVLYGPYDESASAESTRYCVGGAVVRRTVALLVGSWETV